MKKLLTIAIFILALSPLSLKLQATHYMGGEITWECMSNGRYRFILTAYRECYVNMGSAATFGNIESLQSNSPAGNIQLYIKAGWPKDISPVCNSNPIFSHITCIGMANPNANLGAIQEYIWTSDVSYPNGVLLNGVPPANGWTFHWGSCCRNPSTNIVNANSNSWSLRAIMYPNENQSASPCFDNSPVFAEVPTTVVPLGIPFSYNNLAYDLDLDSMSYEWGQPWQNLNTPLTPYATGYSYLNPLPGTTQNQNNIPAKLDSTTGKISLLSYTSGSYVTSIKVTSYRKGSKISEIWRDIQVAIIPTDSNQAPQINPLFNNESPFKTTVYAGDSLDFIISVSNSQLLSTGMQEATKLRVFGMQLGETYGVNPVIMSDIAGCLKPPCAVINPAHTKNGWLVDTSIVQTHFKWKTSCDHLNPSTNTNYLEFSYHFLISSIDDFCPVPASVVQDFTIKVIDKKPLPAPTIDTIFYDYSTNSTIINWTPVLDSANQFMMYYIFKKNSIGANFTLIDSINNLNSYSYIDNAPLASKAIYAIKTKSHNICKNDNVSVFSNSIAIDITSIDPLRLIDEFVLLQNRPNPATNTTSIDYIINKPSKIIFRLQNSSGKIIQETEHNSKVGQNTIQLDTKNLSQGTYFYSIEYNGIKKTNKLLIMR